MNFLIGGIGLIAVIIVLAAIRWLENVRTR